MDSIDQVEEIEVDTDSEFEEIELTEEDETILDIVWDKIAEDEAKISKSRPEALV